MLPQSVWAEEINSSNPAITRDGSTLTINSTAIGSLETLMTLWKDDASKTDKLNSMKACTSIELKGEFKDKDLEAIAYGKGFINVTSVDMSEAVFLSSGGSVSTYKLFKTATSGSSNPYDHAIVEGKLYKSIQALAWTPTGAPAEGTTPMRTPENPSDISGAAEGDYGKIFADYSYKYLQMQISTAWSGPTTVIPADVPSGPLTYDGSTTQLEAERVKLAEEFDNYSANQSVWFWRYYKWNGSAWVEAVSSEYDAAASASPTRNYDNPSGVDLDNLDPIYGREGFVMRVKVYYTKTEGMRNWIGETTTEQTGAAVASFDYAYRENHKSEYSDGQWVKMANYNYYQLLRTGAWTWTDDEISYIDGTVQYINKKYANASEKAADSSYPTGENQYAIVGGIEYVYDGTWKSASSVTEVRDYSQMKFTHWKETITTAITSKYADENISALFDGCNSLTNVDFKAGKVTGFANVAGSDGTLTVKIGKNVTKVASGALNNCHELKTLIFDTDYDTSGDDDKDIIAGVSYPRELVIEDQAFQECFCLRGDIVIPNRVSAIGDYAFRKAGGQTGSACQDISFTFERRFYDDSKTLPVNGYNGTLLTIGNEAFSYCGGLKHISLPIRMTSMGEGIFSNSALESFEIREDVEDAMVKVIPADAFLSCKLKEIKIPRSVIEIMGGAFSNTPTIETITFQKQNTNPQEPLYIHNGAFAGGSEDLQKMKDVYVDFLHTERLVVCEYNAFNFTSMVGQTREGSLQFANLHFPQEDWDFYQGNWKRGLAFRQDNLNAFKDGYRDETKHYDGMSWSPIDESTGKYEHASSGYQYTPANGWQQFACSDTDIDINIPRGKLMRTYSTKKAFVIPQFAEDDNTYGISAGDPMFTIHRITNFSDGYKPGQDKTSADLARDAERVADATPVEHRDRNGRLYIPSETGLMMVGKINTNYVVYFADADFTSEVVGEYSGVTETKYPYNISENSTTGITNLLYPSCIESQRMDGQSGTSLEMTGEPVEVDDNGVSKILLHSTIPYPYHSADTDLKFRLFGYYASSNQFKRVNNAKITRDKAYLKLPKEMFHWTNDYISGNPGSGSGVTEPTLPSSAREITLNFVDDEESGTTGIRQVDTTAQRMDNNVFYTLEGVRLNSRPTQRGIYIHNGRKIVIK